MTAVDAATFQRLTNQDSAKPVEPGSYPPIILNEWAARDLGEQRGGGSASLEYYFWHDDGRLETRTATFYLAAIVPINELAADRDLVPDYPGISASPSLADWDPPFPVNLKLVRKQDERLLEAIPHHAQSLYQLSKGQELWQTRFGNLTSIRFQVGSGNQTEPPKGGTQTL